MTQRMTAQDAILVAIRLALLLGMAFCTAAVYYWNNGWWWFGVLILGAVLVWTLIVFGES